jgi:ankyrin repeat protein
MLSNRFRWVYCQLEALQPCFPNNLRRMLEELPKSLDETYQRILKEINNANQKQAHQLLQCLAVARRPLRVEELAEVLALDVDAGGIPRFNSKWRWEYHEAAVLSACSSLVSVIIDDGSRVVQFSHFSVKEFLTSDRLTSMADVSQFHIADEPSHAILAQACLGVLLSVDDRTSEDSAEDIALLPYADKYWEEHSQVGKVELRIKDALDRLFDLDKPHFEAFFRRIGTEQELRLFSVPSDADPKGVLTPAALIFVAGVFRLSGLVERLMAANPLLIGFRLQGWTLLHLVTHGDHIEFARLLLAHGADINARPDSATPPRIASPQSHVERPVGRSLEEVEKIENSRQKSDADVDVMGYKKESDFTPLHIAVSEGYLDMCQMLLEHKADVRAHDNSGNTPLHLAASEDHLEIARILHKYNAEVNSRNEDGSTPLLMASSDGNIEISQLLLSHDADVFVHDHEGNTPLHLAAIGGHLEVARSLLELKADVSALNNGGLTPLQQASNIQSEGYLDIMRLLLDHVANVNVHDSHRSTLLHFAVSKCHLEVARMLLERKANVNALDDEGLTPLHQASQGSWSGDPYIVQLVRLLLDDGADIHARDNRGNTPLHFAASRGHLEVTRILLELKADADPLNNEGLSPLHRASEGPRKGYLAIFQLFLDHGANLNVHDNRRSTLLHFAASAGHLEVARMLLERKVDVNALDDEGSTPLHQASQSWQSGDPGIVQLVRLLLDDGADIHARDNRGNTPLHFAASRGHFEVTRILLELKADADPLNNEGLSPLQRASEGPRKGYLAIFQLFLDHGANVNVHDNLRSTLLHFAASEGHLEVARMLLERKVDVNALDDEGSTPLHQASQSSKSGDPGIVQLVRLLLDDGADILALDNSGNTPLHFAASRSHLEVARMLLELKADVNALNKDGSTPLHQAFETWQKNPNIVRLLLDHGADANVYDKSGNTFLHFTASEGDLKLTRVLLERIPEAVNSQNHHGSTPLLLASECRTPDVVQLLLDHNPDVHVCDADGDTPLHCAAIAGRLEVARLLLLKLDIEVNSWNNEGATPLHLASEGYWEGNPDIVRLLLDRGADAQARNLSGQTASEIARGPNRQEIVQLLTQNVAE